MTTWWTGLDGVRKALVAAASLFVIGAVIGASPFGDLPGRVQALEAQDARQDSLIRELADGRRFNTCLGLSSIRWYDPEVCERVLPDPERFIPLGSARRMP
ncbi:MAG: hypothetical protein LC667_01315 [Thioalkalivibrio sp.]|nr:hypothetical protein [Thioalkalivibrio sp.]